MLDLLAAAFQDGWAFVKTGKELLLVRPPYSETSVSTVLEETVAKAVQQHGFTVCKATFQDWASFIQFLKSKMLESREMLALPTTEKRSGRGLLEYASPKILRDYLSRIQDELIPNREWRPASDLLIDLISVENVKADPELMKLALRLLHECNKLAQHQERERDELLSGIVASDFPSWASRYDASVINSHISQIVSNQSLWFW